jgi:hypothetical protein
MARRASGPALILALAVASGCKTTQPASAPAQNAQITFESKVSTSVALYEVWDAQKVSVTTFPDQEGRPPEQTVQDLGLWCDMSPNSGQRSRPDVSYPMRFSVEIDRIPAGSSQIVQLTADQYVNGLASVTDYDDSPPETPSSHQVDWSQDLTSLPGTPLHTTVILTLRNGRRISTASRDFIEHVKIAPGTSTSFGSACPFGGTSSSRQLGDPGVAGVASFFGVQVNSGDTIVVKARKDTNPGASALFLGVVAPTFGSRVFLEGRDISSTLVGKASSSQPSEGISYAFTAR